MVIRSVRERKVKKVFEMKYKVVTVWSLKFVARTCSTTTATATTTAHENFTSRWCNKHKALTIGQFGAC